LEPIPGGTVLAKPERDGDAHRIFAEEWLKGRVLDRAPRPRKPPKSLTCRVAFWSAVAVLLLLIVFLGRYLDGASQGVANALTGSDGGPIVAFVLRVVTWVYFLPLALRGVSPSPVFTALVIYLIVGLVSLGRRRWKPALIVLLLPLVCTLPLSLVGLRAADGQADEVKGAFWSAMDAEWSRVVPLDEPDANTRNEVERLSQVDYRFVVFDSSGSKATVASVVTTSRTWEAKSPDGTWKEWRREYKSDYAARMVRQSSGQWVVASLYADFHPGYEP
jgi:hypothetical protein